MPLRSRCVRVALLTLVTALLAATSACRDRVTGFASQEIVVDVTAEGLALRNVSSDKVCYFAIARGAMAYTDFLLEDCSDTGFNASLQPGQSRLLTWESLGKPSEREYWVAWWTGAVGPGLGRVHSVDITR